jgi:hypothetical protein
MEKLTVGQQNTKYLSFMEPEHLMSSPQDSANDLETHKSCPHRNALHLFKIQQDT